MLLTIKVHPKSSQKKIIQESEFVWRVYVHASPINNEANEELIKLISKELGVAQSHLSIVSGHSSKIKKVKIMGV